MNFKDETKFKPLTRFSGFNKGGTSPKDLTYYEASDGYYVSCDGEVWSAKRAVPNKMGGLQEGYRECCIKLKDGKTKRTTIHRLVAEYWVEGFNPEAGRILVNHIDENKTNNHPSNLEWCTNLHNSNHGTRNERMLQSLKQTCKTSEYKEKKSKTSKDVWKNPGSREKVSQSVKGLWKNPEYKAKMSKLAKDSWNNLEFRESRVQSLREAGENPELRVKRSQLAKERWKNPEVRENILKAVRKPVALFNSDGTPHKLFSSCAESAQYAGVSPDTVTNWVKSRKPSKCGKYYWSYYTPEE